MVKTEQITENSKELEIFLDICKKKGYTNNSNLDKLKFQWCLDQGGSWWVTKKENRILAISGVHPFMDGYRTLYRGAQIEPRPYNKLNKYQLQNYAFADHLYEQIKWANSEKIYVTTSPYSDDDRSGKMSRIHKSAKVLAKQGVFKYLYDKEIYHVEQSIWRVNIERYNEIRKGN